MPSETTPATITGRGPLRDPHFLWLLFVNFVVITAFMQYFLTGPRILMADCDDTGNDALAPRSLVALERSLPAERRYSVIHGGAHVMLDHMLASPALAHRCRGLEIHNEALSDELVAFAMDSRSPESYHAPVVASFDLG